MLSGSLLLLAACQPLPQPFADDRPPVGDAMLTVPDGAGVVVESVAGAPAVTSGRLAEAMVKALQDQDVPASAVSGNRRSFTLLGTAREMPLPSQPKPAPARKAASRMPGRSAVDIDWVLHTPEGEAAGRHHQHVETFVAPWREGEPRLMETLAKSAAAGVAGLLQGDMPAASADAGPHGTVRPPVMVRLVQGAPGDGPRALSRAMAAALQAAHYEAALEKTQGRDAGNAFVIAGTVKIDSPAAGKQHVRISWRLLGPDGAEIGQVGQENAVPAGRLDGSWGDIAYVVAASAADGIVALLEKSTSSAALDRGSP